MSSFEPSETLRALERLEVDLARATLSRPGGLPQDREAGLRWAVGLARVRRVGSVHVEERIARYRDEIASLLLPLSRGGAVDLDALAVLAPAAAGRAKAAREKLLEDPSLSAEELDRAVREKRLVLALGGGGGTAWSHLGALALLEENGVRPGLLAASSMGAVLALFRARRVDYDQGEVLHAVRGLSFSRVLRAISTSNRYGLPAAFRLHLRGALSPYLQHPDGSPFTFRDLAIPTVVTISGIRRDRLPRPLSFYEDLVPRSLLPRPWLLPRRLGQLAEVATELARPHTLVPIQVGGSDWTADLDPVDMVGFSCAVPGVIHYDVLREDPEIHRGIGRLLEVNDAVRLIDGGLTENVPAGAAWRAVQEGALGTENALILALDGFSPKLSSALWVPLQRIAQENARRSLEYAHVAVSYSKTLSPTDILPSIGGLIRAIDLGKSQLAHQMPLIRKLTSPLPPLQAVAPDRVRLAV